jgi:hypothetical protein
MSCMDIFFTMIALGSVSLSILVKKLFLSCLLHTQTYGSRLGIFVALFLKFVLLCTCVGGHAPGGGVRQPEMQLRRLQIQ